MSYIDVEPHDGWYEDTIVDFCDNVLPHFGVDVSYKDVAFTGFWSQGDGASFTGRFFLSNVNLTELKASVPTEVELHQLIDQLAELAEAHHDIQGTISRSSSLYSHSNTMIIGEYSSDNDYCTEDFAAIDGEATLTRIFRELAEWLYKRLESSYYFYIADATASQWAEAIEERMTLQDELEQLQVAIAENPPKSMILSNALTTAVAALEVEVETLTSQIDQLTDQFHYWSEGNPTTIEQFYEDYC